MVVLKLMRLVLIIIAFLVTFFPIYINVSAFAIQAKDSTYKTHFTNPCLAKEILISDLVEREGIFYIRDSYWEEYEEVLHGDMEDGLIVRFRSKNEHMPPPAAITIYRQWDGEGWWSDDQWYIICIFDENGDILYKRDAKTQIYGWKEDSYKFMGEFKSIDNSG